MTEPAADTAPALPHVTLAGKDWPIAETLTWRPLSKCRARLLELSGLLSAALKTSIAPDGESPDARAVRELGVVAAVLNGLADEDYERLVMEPIFIAVADQQPALKREDFDALPMTEAERQFAWLGVRRHSGLFVIRAAGDDAEETDPGEGEGSPAPIQTGNE